MPRRFVRNLGTKIGRQKLRLHGDGTKGFWGASRRTGNRPAFPRTIVPPCAPAGVHRTWRSGGYISKPVLANPQFRARYLSRVRELLQTEFTEAKLFPLIDQYGDRLREEVELRASATGQDSARSRQEFESNLTSLKEFVTKRRGWLLAQDEIHNARSSPQK